MIQSLNLIYREALKDVDNYLSLEGQCQSDYCIVTFSWLYMFSDNESIMLSSFEMAARRERKPDVLLIVKWMVELT